MSLDVLRLVAQYVETVLDHSHALVHVGRIGDELPNTTDQHIVIDQIAQMTGGGTAQDYDGTSEVLALGGVWSGEITIDFYGSGADGLARQFALMTRSQLGRDTAEALGITVYPPTGQINLRWLEGASYSGRVQSTVPVSYSESTDLDTLRIDTAQLSVVSDAVGWQSQKPPPDPDETVAWEAVGSPLTVSTLFVGGGMTSMSSTRVALSTDTVGLTAYDWDGAAWSAVGSAFSTASVVAYAHLTGGDIAAVYTNRVRTLRFDGATWSQVGNALYFPSMNAPTAVRLSDTEIALWDSSGTRDLRTVSWDGTDWAVVGTPVSIAGSGQVALTPLSATQVLAIESTTGDLVTYTRDGADAWALDAGATAVAAYSAPAMAYLGAGRLAMSATLADELRLFTGSGAMWAQYGLPLTVTPMTVVFMAALAGDLLAVYESGADALRTYRRTL